MSPAPVIPYCGLPPDPAAIWSRWNLDPVLIAILVGCAAAYAIMSEKCAREDTALLKASFYSGWVILFFALISPLCPLSVSLFCARVGQHVIITMFAAPLIALGLRGLNARPHTLANYIIEGFLRESPIIAALAFALLLWFWHSPRPYAATFTSSTTYWLMHVSMIGASLWLWSNLIDTAPVSSVRVLLAGLASTVQMGFLGALITFTPRPLYTPHLLTTTAWGFTPLQDQQLGGVVMWVPGCVIFLAAASVVLWRVMQQAELAVNAAISAAASEDLVPNDPIAVEAR
jgi:putative membrane protein